MPSEFWDFRDQMRTERLRDWASPKRPISENLRQAMEAAQVTLNGDYPSIPVTITRFSPEFLEILRKFIDSNLEDGK